MSRCWSRTAGTRGPGSTMPARFSGSAADSATVSPVRGRFLISRSMPTASGCANCSPLNPCTNRPPQIVPRASIRRSAHSTSRHGTARFSRASRSRNTTPQRAASCSATASARSSGSQSSGGSGSSDHRPAVRELSWLPRRSRRRPGPFCIARRANSVRTARKPSAVIRPRATPSHSASSTSDGSRPVCDSRSGGNSAPRCRSASRTSLVLPGPGFGGPVLAAGRAQQPRQVVADGQGDRGGPGRGTGRAGAARPPRRGPRACPRRRRRPGIPRPATPGGIRLPGPEDGLLPGPSGQLEALQLLDHGQHPWLPSLGVGGDAPPAQQEPDEVGP